MRKVYQPSLDDSWGAVPIDNGGSSSKKLPTAIQYLGLLTNSSMGAEHGSADLDANGKVKHINLPDSIISEVVNVSGPSSLKINQTGIYTITDFDSAMNYVIAAISGIVTRNGDTITYTADASPGNGGFTLNGKAYIIPVTYYSVVTPNVTSPTNGQSGLSGTVNFSSNAFAMEGGTDTHLVSDWQLSTQANFATLVNSTSGDSGNKTSWTVSNLNPNTSYYVRVRYKGVVSEYSDWSPVINFTTSVTFAPNPPMIMTPSDGETGVAIAPTIVAGPFNSPGVDEHYSTDWQISTDSIFSNIISSATDDTLNKYVWNVTGLSDLTQYYIRARYKGSTYGYGAWSATVGFVTIQANSINTPSISSPANASDGNSLSPSLSSSVFSVTGGSDTHQSSDWQIATDSNFSNIVASVTGDTVNKTTWSTVGLTLNTTYYVRVRYKGANLPYSAWSPTSQFSTIHVNTPSITSPTNAATGLMPAITLTGSAFAVTGASDTHASSTWQIATDSNFNTIVTEVNNSSTYKISWTVNLNLNTTYYARVRYNGTTYSNSNWSNTVSFSTIANYTPNVPGITSPVAAATNQGPMVSFTATAFAMNGGNATHTSSDWQIATDAGFTTLVSSATGDTVNKTTWTSASLAVNTTFYARVRYRASNGIYSAWSTVLSFTTKAVYVPNSEEAIINRPFVSGQVTASGFSFSVAIDQSGDRVVIGAYQSDYKSINLTGTTGTAYVYVRTGSTWALEQQLLKELIYIFDSYYQTNYNVTSTSCGDEAFGTSVDITPDGTRIAVGAPFYNHCYQRYGGSERYYNDVGRVIIYTRSGSSWTQEQILLNINDSTPVFGYCVSISNAGDRLLVGGPNSYRSYVNEGQVNYWTRSGSVWTRQGSINLSDPTGADMKLGLSVAISGDGSRAIVGIPGAAKYRIFSLSATSGTLEVTISGTAGSQLGTVVDINGDGTMAVGGAPNFNSNKGTVYLCKRSGTTWSNIAFTSPTASSPSGDYFGTSVSLSADGQMLVVGALHATRSGLGNTGSVYILGYNSTTNQWSVITEVTASDKIANGYYSRSARISADKSRMIVGNEIRNKCYIYS